MKLFMLFAILSISSCNLTGELYIPDQNISIEVNTIQQALDYVSSYTYKLHYGVYTPEEFYTNGHGDCEDFSIMLLYLFTQKLNLNAYLILGKYNNSTNHAWVELSNGDWYDATAGCIITTRELFTPEYKYTYDEAIRSIFINGGFLPDVNKY